MIKHLGRHNNKKVVILYREVPDEEHMCLVVYPESLAMHTQEVVMKALESPAGQEAKSFSDVLFRTLLIDGRNALSTMHTEGNIKKINTSQVIVTPTPTSSVRLDELNDILREMEKGEEAIKRLHDLDSAAGMSGKRTPKMRDLGEARTPANSVTNVPESNYSGEDMKAAVDAFKGDSYGGILSDGDLAKQRISQAAQLKLQVESMLAEAARLESEAAALDPTIAKVVTQNEDSSVKKRGRPKATKV